jgi:ABC-type glycerol-3-phosphate transport system permease component
MTQLEMVHRRSNYRLWRSVSKGLIYILVTFGAFLCLFPFYWMAVVATRTSGEIFNNPPVMIPGTLLMENVHSLLKLAPFIQAYGNSIFYAGSVTVLMLFFDSLAGFAFAKYKFPGQNFLFSFLLATMMIPGAVMIIPWFVEMKFFNWLDSYKALIIPGAVDAFGIFWMRQFITDAVPSELLDAARIDGAHDFNVYLRIVIPIISPALGALAILTFMAAWNNLISPMIIFSTPSKFPLTIVLRTLVSLRLTDYGALMAGAFLSVLPIIIVFLLGARRFISGITAGSIQGM